MFFRDDIFRTINSGRIRIIAILAFVLSLYQSRLVLVLCHLNSLLASGDFCHLLITFANSLDPDQDRQIVGPDLDGNSLTLRFCS